MTPTPKMNAIEAARSMRGGHETEEEAREVLFEYWKGLVGKTLRVMTLYTCDEKNVLHSHSVCLLARVTGLPKFMAHTGAGRFVRARVRLYMVTPDSMPGTLYQARATIGGLAPTGIVGTRMPHVYIDRIYAEDPPRFREFGNWTVVGSEGETR
jgi:hypothetical protein